MKNHLLPPLLMAVSLLMLNACSSGLQAWHTVKLDREYSLDRSREVQTLEDYLALEASVFEQLDEEIYQGADTGPGTELRRYSPGSAADPRSSKPDWNRSFQFQTANPKGSVLLLHGMSDSPYSLRAIGQALHKQGYQVLGLRLPGHGTAPSGMLSVHWNDMSAAVSMAMAHLFESPGNQQVHIIGYSTGAALALDYALEAPLSAQPASLVLISPAIGIHPTAALASWKRRLSLLPGLEGLAWLDLEAEFDPYKYNSFATNAAEQVHRLTRSVGNRVAQRAGQPGLPPVLVFKSAVDATVSNDALVDRLMMQLPPNQNELVLFDINRFAPTVSLMRNDPGPFTQRLLQDRKLPFTLTILGNTEAGSRELSIYRKPPFTRDVRGERQADLAWPPGVFSLSHVALPLYR